MIEENHSFDISTVKLLKSVPKPMLLDAYESIFISKFSNNMNGDDGPISSELFKIMRQ